MNAEPFLAEVAHALGQADLEAVLIGNAAAALQGAPVTTVDLDFMFRKTPRTIRKLKQVADLLHAFVLRPYYPASDLYRLTRDDDGLQVDFMATVHGLPSFEAVRDRATVLHFGESALRVAPLRDVIASKRAAGRPRDRAVLDLLERALETQKHAKGEAPRSQERK